MARGQVGFTHISRKFTTSLHTGTTRVLPMCGTESCKCQAGITGFMFQADGLTEEEIVELRGAFSLYDRDNDGLITIHELGVFMRSLGFYPTESELHAMINEVNNNGSGTMDFSEFLTIMSDPCTDTEVLDTFKVFDRDGNGFIDAAELCHVMKSLGETFTNEDIEEMIREADLDGDELLNFDEFAQVVADT